MAPKVRQLVTAAVTLVTACGPADRAPVFNPVDANQVAHVGQEYVLTLRANDAEGDALTFSFSAPAPADLPTRASIAPLGDGTEATFRWSPQAADVGTVDIDFHVTDGHTSVTETVAITVTPPASQQPLWVAPLGAGTTLDLAHTKCLDLQITVQDPGAARVDIAQAAPVIDGATLTKSGDFGATWHWCPSTTQVDAADVYNLSLSASDGLKKLYRILLVKPSCASGTAPTVASVSRVLYTVASESVGNSRRTVACSSSALGWLSVVARCRKIARRCGVTARPAARHWATKPWTRSRMLPPIIILLGE